MQEEVISEKNCDKLKSSVKNVSLSRTLPIINRNTLWILSCL